MRTLPFHLAVAREVGRARHMHPTPIHSLHEGYAVILEELEEFKAEVFRKASERDPERLYDELVQVAAMAKRIAEDVLDAPRPALDGHREDPLP